jgi:type I restriction enzyme S subunit
MYGQGKTRGNCSILGIPAYITQNAAAIEPTETLNTQYLWQYLRSQYDNLRGEGVHGHIAHLNLGFVKQLQVPLPNMDVQENIARTLQLIDENIEANIRLIAKRKVLKSGLIQDLLSGKVRI